MELTREAVINEPPGKRLNSWVAQRAIGYVPEPVPDYSNDLGAAFDIINYIGHVELKTRGSWAKCRILVREKKGPSVEGYMSIPEAITKAVLLVMLQEEKKKKTPPDNILF